MQAKTNKFGHPSTTHSLTSIAIPESHKIDNVLVKLEGRRKQLIEILNKSAKQGKYRVEGSREEGDCRQNGQEVTKGIIADRKKKYQSRIEHQKLEMTDLKAQLEKIEARVMQLVMQIQDGQISLKKISQGVGDLCRKALGMDEPECHSSKIWFYHKILDLEQTLPEQISLSSIICSFYCQSISPQAQQEKQIFWQIIRLKQVNKLYGYFIQKQANHCRSQHHQTWLHILKCMKALEKLEPIPGHPEDNPELNSKHVHKQVNRSVTESLRVKMRVKQFRNDIKAMNVRKQEIMQQISIKEEFIGQLSKKLSKIEAQSKQITVDQNKNTNLITMGVAECQKQLKQLNQAIKYFSIKKQTLQWQPKNTTIAQVKSIQDMSTTFLSPQKSLLIQRNLSPQMMTITRQMDRTKYTLRQLLSPPKFMNTLDKRRAWK